MDSTTPVQAYSHFFPKARPMGDYPSKYTFTLITDHSHLDQVIESCTSSVIAVDTETTSLNHTTATIVGISFCFDKHVGYYIPLNHDSGNIDDLSLVYSKLSSFFQERKILFYNKRFDLRILESVNLPINFKHFDVQILVWQMDSNIKFPSLKWAEEHFLGWTVDTFEDLTASHSVEMLHPVAVCQYAATDALGTYHLYTRLSPSMNEHTVSLMLDNAALDIVKILEETPLSLDYVYLESILPAIDSTISTMKLDIFKLAGKVFNPNSPDQIGQVLLENGCAPDQRTKTGKISTGSEIISKIDHPLPKLLCEYSSLNKIRSSYITKLINEGKERGGKLHISHKTTDVPTGRIAAGSDSKNDFFAKINIMSIPKPKTFFYKPVPSTSSTSIVGYDFIPVGEKAGEGLVEGFSPDINIRRAFTAPEGYMWVSIDWNAQELRLPANFSREPVLVTPFLNNEDVHTNVAKAVFGDVITKKQRSAAKVLSFGLLYGGNAYTIREKLNCSIEEARDFVNLYEKSHRVLYAWKAAVIKKAKLQGYINTYYKRPRRLRSYFVSSDFKMVKFGERSTISSVIQGTASDILKKSLITIYREENSLFKDGTILFHPLVHDEINFLIRIDSVVPITMRIMKHMTVQEEGWAIPMTVEASFGKTWGDIYPFKLINSTFVPKT